MYVPNAKGSKAKHSDLVKFNRPTHAHQVTLPIYDGAGASTVRVGVYSDTLSDGKACCGQAVFTS